MALKKCKECGNEVSTKAKECPKCGAPVRRSTASGCLIIILGIIIFGTFGSLFDGEDSKTTIKKSAPALAQPKVTNGTLFAAPTERTLDKACQYLSDKDLEAFNKLLESKQIFMLPAGWEVYITKRTGGKIKIRRAGETLEFWTLKEAVQSKKAVQEPRDATPNAERKTSNSWREKDDSDMAYIMMGEFVEKRLKSAKSAEFPPFFEIINHVTYLGDQKYLIDSYVDAQNSSGATIRSDFVGEIQQTSKDRWSLLTLTLTKR